MILFDDDEYESHKGEPVDLLALLERRPVHLPVTDGAKAVAKAAYDLGFEEGWKAVLFALGQVASTAEEEHGATVPVCDELIRTMVESLATGRARSGRKADEFNLPD